MLRQDVVLETESQVVKSTWTSGLQFFYGTNACPPQNSSPPTWSTFPGIRGFYIEVAFYWRHFLLNSFGLEERGCLPSIPKLWIQSATRSWKIRITRLHFCSEFVMVLGIRACTWLHYLLDAMMSWKVKAHMGKFQKDLWRMRPCGVKCVLVRMGTR